MKLPIIIIKVEKYVFRSQSMIYKALRTNDHKKEEACILKNFFLLMAHWAGCSIGGLDKLCKK
jgi:hypothetical protein